MRVAYNIAQGLNHVLWADKVAWIVGIVGLDVLSCGASSTRDHINSFCVVVHIMVLVNSEFVLDTLDPIL